FTLSTAATSNTLSVLLPPGFGGRALVSVQVDGAAAQPADFEVAGRTLARIGVEAGRHTLAARDSSAAAPPTVVLVAPPTAVPSAPTSQSADRAPPPPGAIDVSAILWATIAVVVVVLAVVVAVMAGRGRPRRR